MRAALKLSIPLTLLATLPLALAQQAPPAGEPAAPAEQPAPSPAKPRALAEDPYLTNYKHFEHREERAAGRGPQGRKLGLGVGLGRPMSLGFKLYFTQTIAVQGDVGATYSWFGPEVDAQMHGIWHVSNLLVRDEFKVSAYIGAGGRVAAWPLVLTGIPEVVPTCRGVCRRPVFNYFPGAESIPGTLGIQGLGGLSLFVQRYPLELYAQPIGTVELFPGLSGDVGFQLGLRWYVF